MSRFFHRAFTLLINNRQIDQKSSSKRESNIILSRWIPFLGGGHVLSRCFRWDVSRYQRATHDGTVEPAEQKDEADETNKDSAKHSPEKRTAPQKKGQEKSGEENRKSRNQAENELWKTRTHSCTRKRRNARKLTWEVEWVPESFLLQTL